jgi:hypothetical protein
VDVRAAAGERDLAGRGWRNRDRRQQLLIGIMPPHSFELRADTKAMMTDRSLSEAATASIAVGARVYARLAFDAQGQQLKRAQKFEREHSTVVEPRRARPIAGYRRVPPCEIIDMCRSFVRVRQTVGLPQ